MTTVNVQESLFGNDAYIERVKYKLLIFQLQFSMQTLILRLGDL